MCTNSNFWKCGYCNECIGVIKMKDKKLYCNNCGDKLIYHIKDDGKVYVEFCECVKDELDSAYSDGFDTGFDAGESEI